MRDGKYLEKLEYRDFVQDIAVKILYDFMIDTKTKKIKPLTDYTHAVYTNLDKDMEYDKEGKLKNPILRKWQNSIEIGLVNFAQNQGLSLPADFNTAVTETIKIASDLHIQLSLKTSDEGVLQTDQETLNKIDSNLQPLFVHIDEKSANAQKYPPNFQKLTKSLIQKVGKQLNIRQKNIDKFIDYLSNQREFVWQGEQNSFSDDINQQSPSEPAWRDAQWYWSRSIFPMKQMPVTIVQVRKKKR